MYPWETQVLGTLGPSCFSGLSLAFWFLVSPPVQALTKASPNQRPPASPTSLHKPHLKAMASNRHTELFLEKFWVDVLGWAALLSVGVGLRWQP